MERKDIFNKVKKIVADNLSVEESEITEKTSFVEDLGADSLDLVDLVMVLEKELGISIDDEKLSDLSTVSDVIELIEKEKDKVDT
ncbi:MAG: acyl carrier protein [Thermotogota bacterium]|nr:acyl carrier protein [Thermotogota bacterium]